jgi:tripartite-type tricarboxylate transporter receptor subunit TctC
MSTNRSAPFHTTRRRVATALAVAPLAATLHPARAQGALPRTVSLLVPQTTGGSNDVFARALAVRLAKAVDTSVIVENRPGAGGNLGSAWVARSAPRDGSMWLVTVNSVQSMGPILYKNAGFDPIGDFEPVGAIALVPHVLLANPAVPVAGLADVVELARRDPAKYSYGSSGNGTFSHLLMELMKKSRGISITHVPYKGVAPALTDLVGGQIQYVISTVPAAMGFVRGGQLKPLAVTSLSRAAALPDVPLANDVVPGMVGELWIGVYGPKGVPREALEAMRAGVAKVQAMPDWEAFCASQGAAPMKAGAAELASMTRQEIDKWGPLVRETGMQID